MVETNTKIPKKEATQKQAILSAPVYDMEGTMSGSVTLPENIFSRAWNAVLVRQVILAQQANARIPVAHTKGRGEVSGGGRKPWRQKGTGRARHGSIRSPIWKGGGVTHGPRNEKSYKKRLTRHMRTGALASVLTKKFSDGEILFVKELSPGAPKTRFIRERLDAFGKIKGFEMLPKKRKNAVLIATPERNETLEKSCANFGNVFVTEVRNLSPVLLLSAKYLVIVDPQRAIEALKERFSKNQEQETSTS